MALRFFLKILLGFIIGSSTQAIQLLFLDTRSGCGTTRWSRAVTLGLVFFRPAATTVSIGRADLLCYLSIGFSFRAAYFYLVLLMPFCFRPGSEFRR